MGLLFSFFNIYMGWQTQWDGLGFLEGGWAKKKGAGPSLLLGFFFFGKIYLLIFFFGPRGDPGPLRPPPGLCFWLESFML